MATIIKLDKDEDGNYNYRGIKLKSKIIIWVAVIFILVIIFLATTFYTIGPDEEGIILRFGKYSHKVGAGLHIKLPFGIDRLYVVKTKHVFKEEFGFRTIKAGRRTEYSSKTYPNESLMLTGDLNIADIEWIVQYKISDPLSYLFSVKEPKDAIRDTSEAVIRAVVGDKTINQVLRVERESIERQAYQMMQHLIDKYKIGIRVIAFKIQTANPPEMVKPSFNEVNMAMQDMERAENEAREIFNKKVNEIKGKALKMIKEAQAFAVQKTNIAYGDAIRFEKLIREYVKAPQITKQRLYIETLQYILKKINKVYIIDENQKGVLKLLDLKEVK